MKTELIEEVNEQIRLHNNLVPKSIVMTRKAYDELIEDCKKDISSTLLENIMNKNFYGIRIYINNELKIDFEIHYFVQGE